MKTLSANSQSLHLSDSMPPIPPRHYPPNVYGFLDYAARISRPAGWKHDMCGDVRKYSLNTAVIRTMIETNGIDYYKAVA